MTNHRSKELTRRQAGFAKNLLNGATITEAARKAGYSEKNLAQSGHQALKAIQLKVPELMDDLGLTTRALIEEHLVPQLSATTTKFFQHKGKVTDKRIVPDNDARLKALDMGFKLRGAYAPTEPKPEYPIGVRVIMVDIPRPGDPDLPQLPYPESRS